MLTFCHRVSVARVHGFDSRDPLHVGGLDKRSAMCYDVFVGLTRRATFDNYKGATMPLRWHVDQCADWHELVCESDPSPMGGSVYVDSSTNEHRNEDRITQHLVFMTMEIGMDQITEKNFKEFYRRTKVMEERWNDNLRLCVITGDGDDDYEFPVVPVTLDMVERRIGLSTNANGRYKTKREFDNLTARTT